MGNLNSHLKFLSLKIIKRIGNDNDNNKKNSIIVDDLNNHNIIIVKKKISNLKIMNLFINL